MNIHQLTTYRARALYVLISAGGLLSACSSDSSLPEPPATPEVPVVVEPPVEEPSQLLAIAPIPDNCADNSLCNFAAQTANQFAEVPDNTCNIRELSFQGLMDASADINTGDSPHAWVSNSGLMQYLLNNSDGASEAAYQELEEQTLDDFNRPLAFQYHNYFAALIDGTQTSGSWTAMNDLNQLQAGDVLSWCVNDWCDGTPGSGDLDTGHTAIVVQASVINRENIVSHTKGVPDTAQFFEVSVVDAAHQIHDSIFTDELRVGDRRHHSGRLKNPACHFNGGLGSGVILLAQWNDGESDNWSVAWHNEGNHHFHNEGASGPINMAFGRIQ